LGQIAAIYCRVSTSDQDCNRQETDLSAFATKAGYTVIGVWKETASGSKNDRKQRQQVLNLAQARKIDLVD
jgi:DNA invertase Pin-like site-specific DNA recombinase